MIASRVFAALFCFARGPLNIALVCTRGQGLCAKALTRKACDLSREAQRRLEPRQASEVITKGSMENVAGSVRVNHLEGRDFDLKSAALVPAQNGPRSPSDGNVWHASRSKRCKTSDRDP